jgi:hypothetical protein
LNSAEIRDQLVKALNLDLIGPEPGDSRENEILDRPPSREYLTGFIVPYEPPEGRPSPQLQLVGEDTEQEGIDQVRGAGLDDDQSPEAASSRRVYFPSSIGISVLIPKEAQSIKVTVLWGDYKLVAPPENGEERGNGNRSRSSRARWERKQRKPEPVVVSVAKPTAKPIPTDVPDSDGLRLITSVRAVDAKNTSSSLSQLVPEGTRSVSIFLVNYRRPAPDERRDEAFAFQARLILHMDQPFVSRPNLRGLELEDWDERVADLQYADCYEFAVGHGIATNAREEGGKCNLVSTVWIPSAEVEKVEAAAIPGAELGMDALATMENSAAMRKSLGALITGYQDWIEKQKSKLSSDTRRREIGEELLNRASQAKDRIAAGIACLDEPNVLYAFRLMNRAMATVIGKRQTMAGLPIDEKPSWRPFQLAFILMNLRGIAEPLHPDRSVVDLLFFPTGGGKTEAYLGLAAFTLVLRRLKNRGIASAGVSVLMRYTLRLLTLEQLSRAATLICGLELERQRDADRLGPWPFEIGLWVGMAATPNVMGRKGDNNDDSARSRTIRFQNNSKANPAPIPLEECPWCGTKFTTSSFSLVPPKADAPTNLQVTCANRRCEFRGGNPLPIVGIDQPIYRRLPCFIVATVDKFAGLPWLGPAGGLFGKAERYDKEGFYGACDPGVGSRLPNPLIPPDLIIQDELHLISGPLGTIAGLYEAAIDALCSRELEGKTVRPKIVASTATVRRAYAQVKALFGRDSVEIFPPPGPDRRDSFFAVTMPAAKRNARRYTGIAAAGRSLKRAMLVTYLALMGAAKRFYDEAGGNRNPENPADPYMTLVGYFNSLRELGGSRRIVEDEVTSRLKSYGGRMRLGENKGLFADREIKQEVLELTSRESTDKVANSKRRLALRFNENDRVDVALATNMISVGLDIVRLGLMVVLGQPKTTAEYIQATSRVGRDDQRPGLVVTLLNIHRPRDRSHYERFETWHASFYRGVETTSVTPFSPRAIDRSLAAVTVALARHGNAAFTGPKRAVEAANRRPELEFVADILAARAERHATLSPEEAEDLRKKLKTRVDDLLDAWASIAFDKQKTGGLQYQVEEGGAPRLLFDPLDADLVNQPLKARKFKAQRSMRNIEPVVNLWVQRMDGSAVEDD